LDHLWLLRQASAISKEEQSLLVHTDITMTATIQTLGEYAVPFSTAVLVNHFTCSIFIAQFANAIYF
jgi:hypothetical protein